MKLRRSWIWYLAGLILAVGAGLVAVLALQQAVPTPAPVKPATRSVIVAKTPIEARQVVLIDAVEVRDFPIDELPSGAIFRVEDVVGKFTLDRIEAGQPVLAQNLVTLSSSAGITTTAKLSALLPADKIAVVLPAVDLLSRSGAVDTGDHIDILASLAVASSVEGKGGQVTLLTLQDVPVVKALLEVTQNSSGQANQPSKVAGLIVAVDPQDAVTLKYFVDAGANVSIGLRPPRLTSIFEVVPVTINYLADKFGIKAPELLP